ncbi:transcription factor BIM2-like isoform X2 [Zingiber officinale]|uniref:transcription factor BIM2-like isoform X2 n=1 Tax=Zingiber officinale TaxID=94328 RepID=UPI001C4C8AEC|nr:transcription factor BIM2-like isoform X2 [Zingiber officinale]
MISSRFTPPIRPSSFQILDPPPEGENNERMTEGFILKTRDFLRPLEKEEGYGNDVAEVPATVKAVIQAEGVLPSGVGAYTVSHAPLAAAIVKASGSARGFPILSEAKSEPDYGSRSTGTSYGSLAGGASYTLWDEKDTVSRGQWPSCFPTAHGSSGPTSVAGVGDDIGTSGRHDPAWERKQFMVLASSVPIRGRNRSNNDEEFGKRESSSACKDLSIKVEENARCNDQRPNTPRSKHSATEQRRRCKINDRFHILRGIIPHSDQKRDKASFLLEVIEYVRFLQEKVQKYESLNPECGQDDVKLMPWKFSLQKNSSHVPANGLSVSHVVSDDSSTPTHIYSKKVNESSIPSVAFPTPTSITLNQQKTCVVSGGISYKKTMDANNLAPTHCTHNLLFPLGRETNTTDRLQPKSLEAHNTASQDQCGWLRSCGLADGAVVRQGLYEKETLIIDEGTINVSTAYSHELLNTLIQTLQSSGINLSQANVSVQIDLGKRAANKRLGSTTCTNKDKEDSGSYNQAKGCSRSRALVEEPSESSKRLKTHDQLLAAYLDSS